MAKFFVAPGDTLLLPAPPGWQPEQVRDYEGWLNNQGIVPTGVKCFLLAGISEPIHITRDSTRPAMRIIDYKTGDEITGPVHDEAKAGLEVTPP